MKRAKVQQRLQLPRNPTKKAFHAGLEMLASFLRMAEDTEMLPPGMPASASLPMLLKSIPQLSISKSNIIMEQIKSEESASLYEK
jgi:uncharacterized protein involved in exopolysaccharide biosynthesis